MDLKIKYYIEQLLSAGTHANLSSHEQFRLRSLNLFCLACSIIPFVYIYMLWDTPFYLLNYVFLFFQILFSLSIAFNFLHKNSYSRLILVFATSVSVVIVSWITGFESGFHLYVYAAPLFVFLLFKLTEIKYIFISICVYLTSYLLIFIHKTYFNPLYLFDKHFIVDLLYPINLIMNFTLLLLLFYSYTKFYFIMEKDLLEKQRHLILENNKRTQSEQQTLKLFNELSQSYTNLEKFSFIVSHNLRAPLTNILALTQLVDNEKIDNENKNIVDKIAISAQQLDDVFTDLNYILKIKTQKIDKKTWCPIDKIIQNVQDKIALSYPNIAIQYQLNFDKNIQLYSVQTFLEIIIYNIFENAIKFRKTSNALIIEVNVTQIEDTHQISFHDNGMGINLQLHQNRLFTLYGKCNNKTIGKGMGLYLVKIYTELLNGSIAIESEENVFTKLTITL